MRMNDMCDHVVMWQERMRQVQAQIWVQEAQGGDRPEDTGMEEGSGQAQVVGVGVVQLRCIDEGVRQVPPTTTSLCSRHRRTLPLVTVSRSTGVLARRTTSSWSVTRLSRPNIP